SRSSSSQSRATLWDGGTGGSKALAAKVGERRRRRRARIARERLHPSVDSRNEPPRPRAIVRVRRAERVNEKGFLAPRAEIAADDHQDESDPDDRGRNPDGRAESEEIQRHVDRMSEQPERTFRGELVPRVELRAEAPRPEEGHRPRDQRGAERD